LKTVVDFGISSTIVHLWARTDRIQNSTGRAGINVWFVSRRKSWYRLSQDTNPTPRSHFQAIN